MEMTANIPRPGEHKAAFLKRLGADLRRIRRRTDISCEAASAVIGDPNRDRISKVERGASGIEFYDYLRLMWFYRDEDPMHPAVQLARILLPEEDWFERAGILCREIGHEDQTDHR
jgi:hypothetical protein